MYVREEFKDICREIAKRSIEGYIKIIDKRDIETMLHISKGQWYGLKTWKNGFSEEYASRLLEGTNITLKVLSPYSREYENIINLDQFRSTPNPLLEIKIGEITINCDFTIRIIDSLFAKIMGLPPGVYQTRNIDLALSKFCSRYRNSEGQYELPLILSVNLSKLGLIIVNQRVYYHKIIPDTDIEDLENFVKEQDAFFKKIWSPSYLQTYNDILEMRRKSGWQ